MHYDFLDARSRRTVRTLVTEQITIDHRFRGPPGSANGGYTCGRVAQFAGNPAEVTLRSRPPLQQMLEVEQRGDKVLVMHEDTLVAEGTAAEPKVQVPDPVGFEEAHEVSGPLPDHYFPECFVCGPLRQPEDGLCIYPDPIESHDVVAAAWVPDPTLAQEDETVEDVYMWSALDCPSGFSASFLGPRSTIILGRLTAQLIEPVTVGQRLIVMGFPVRREGRKLFTGSAIFCEQGDVKGVAQATWIELR